MIKLTFLRNMKFFEHVQNVRTPEKSAVNFAHTHTEFKEKLLFPIARPRTAKAAARARWREESSKYIQF